MDRVDVKTAMYIAAWNENYAVVNDREITGWLVRNVMTDLECWIEGRDPNGARVQADMVDWTRDELIHLYRGLAASAMFFGPRHWSVRSEYLNET